MKSQTADIPIVGRTYGHEREDSARMVIYALAVLYHFSIPTVFLTFTKADGKDPQDLFL